MTLFQLGQKDEIVVGIADQGVAAAIQGVGAAEKFQQFVIAQGGNHHLMAGDGEQPLFVELF